MYILTVIEQFGIPKNEAKIYLISLKMGEATVSELARKTNMPRSTVQEILEKMNTQGLMNSYLKKRRMHWMAQNPDKLLIQLKEREAALKTIMPDLQAMRHGHGGEPTVRLFQGPEEIKRIMDDIVDTRHNLSAIVSWQDWVDFFGKEMVEGFIEQRYIHFLKARLLTPKSPLAESLKQRDDKELRLTRFLPSQTTINNSNFIYGNKVAIISLNRRQPFGIVMEDVDIAHTMTVLFESLWLTAAI